MIATLNGVVLDNSGSVAFPSIQNLALPQGEYAIYTLNVKKQDGTAFNLTGYSLVMTIRKNGQSTSLVARTGAITNAASGVATFTFTKVDTWTATPDNYVYDVFITETATDKSYDVVPQSIFSILDAVTDLSAPTTSASPPQQLIGVPTLPGASSGEYLLEYNSNTAIFSWTGKIPTELLSTSSYGTLDIKAGVIGDADSNKLLQFQPAESGSVPFNLWSTQFTNSGSASKNQVARWGWNIAVGGANEVPGRAAIADEWEANYVPGSTFVERHITYVSPAGSVYRPLSWRIDTGTNHISQLVTGDDVTWFSRAGSALFVMNLDSTAGGSFQLNTQAPLFHWFNAVTAFAQRNAANTGWVDIVEVDSSDAVLIAPNGATRIKMNATIQNTVGANEVTTVGSAGGASALPATPTKYLIIKDQSGNNFKIPLYNP